MVETLTQTDMLNIGLLRLGQPLIADIMADSQDGIPLSQYRTIKLAWKTTIGVIPTEWTWWELRRSLELNKPLGTSDPGYTRYNSYLLPDTYAGFYSITNREGRALPGIRHEIRGNRIYVEQVEGAVLKYTSNDLSQGLKAGRLAELYGLRVASMLAKPEREDRTLGERLKSEYQKELNFAIHHNDATEPEETLNPTEFVDGRFFGRGYINDTYDELRDNNINPVTPIPRPSPTERE